LFNALGESQMDDDYKAAAPMRETGGFGMKKAKANLDALFSSGDEEKEFVPEKKQRETKANDYRGDTFNAPKPKAPEQAKKKALAAFDSSSEEDMGVSKVDAKNFSTA
jgi:hypothetical protein